MERGGVWPPYFGGVKNHEVERGGGGGLYQMPVRLNMTKVNKYFHHNERWMLSHEIFSKGGYMINVWQEQ